MIDGLKLDMPGADVASHITTRIVYHTEKRDAYAKQREEITALMAHVGDGQSGDPRGTLDQHQRTHADRVEYFALLFRYLNPNETYRLSAADLTNLEFTTRGW